MPPENSSSSATSRRLAAGQEAIVADTLQAGWQNVLEEAADELLGGDGHHLGFACVAVNIQFFRPRN
jgi:hypothetical protein